MRMPVRNVAARCFPPEDTWGQVGTDGSGCGKSGCSRHFQGTQMQVEEYPTDMNSSKLRPRIWLCPPNSRDYLKDPLGLLGEPSMLVPHTYTEELHPRVNGPQVPISWAGLATKGMEFEVMYPTLTLPARLLMTLGWWSKNKRGTSPTQLHP